MAFAKFFVLLSFLLTCYQVIMVGNRPRPGHTSKPYLRVWSKPIIQAVY